MSRILPLSMALSLALSLVFETGFFLLVGKRDRKDILLLLLVNVLTNPVVVLLYWLTALYTTLNTYFVIVPLELFAILTEGYYYRRYGNSFRSPYLFSLAANIFSFGIGEFIQLLF